jgi:hypothetical protein
MELSSKLVTWTLPPKSNMELLWFSFHFGQTGSRIWSKGEHVPNCESRIICLVTIFTKVEQVEIKQAPVSSGNFEDAKMPAN